MKPPIADNERGAVLILVLCFVAAFGLFAAALLSQGDANFRTTVAVKDQNSKVYAADAGIEYGINTLKAETQWCPDPSAGVMQLPSTTVDGVNVDVTCQTQAGNGAGGYGYAVITNNPGPASISTQSGAQKKIVGLIYNSGGWNLQADLRVSQGSVFQRTYPGCPAGPAPSGGTQTLTALGGSGNLTIDPSPPFGWTCTSASPPNPAHDLPTSVPPTAAIPTRTGSGSTQCTTLHPGTYNGSAFALPAWVAKNFTSATSLFDGPTYMESGVYYFDNVSTISLNGGTTEVRGGRPATPGDSTVLTPSARYAACGFNDPGTDTGVEIILGGNSKISVDQGAQAELFTHTSTAAGKPTDGISLYQVPPGAPAPWNSAFTTLTPDTFFLDVSGNASTVGDFHGAIYGPSGSVTLFVSNAAGASLFGGADVWNIVMQSSGSSPPGGLQVSTIQTTPGQRQIVVTATAKGVSGTKNIVSKAVILIDNSITPRQANILSWWTSNP